MSSVARRGPEAAGGLEAAHEEGEEGRMRKLIALLAGMLWLITLASAEIWDQPRLEELVDQCINVPTPCGEIESP
jgi:hypothetical protein